jgi:hypothetical protein
LVILPRKISATAVKGNLIGVASGLPSPPFRFTTIASAPATVGNIWMPEAAANCSSFRMASEAPKSTVFSVICLMPPPEPIDW